MDIVFEMMGPHELDEVMALENKSFESPWPASMFEEELDREFSYTLLARDGSSGRLAGFIIYWVLIDEMHILDIAVGPGYRRRGIGRAMVGEALRQASELGALSATLEVRSRNRAAISLYEDAGFRPAGLRPGYYDKPPDDAVIMWLRPID